MVTCSKLPSEDGSVISNESEKLRSGRGLTVLKVTAQQKVTKEETHKKDGESGTVMEMQISRRTALLQTRSAVSQNAKQAPSLPFFYFFFSNFLFVVREGNAWRKGSNTAAL